MIFRIGSEDNGKLLRTFLREHGVSAALLARLKREENGILLDGKRVTVRACLAKGSILELAVEDKDAPVHVVPRELPLDVLLCTEDLAVLNKPANMPTHPSHGHFEDTLANALVFAFSAPNMPFRPRFINRLDRNTTGAVLVAMHALSAAALSRAMAAGEIQKTYLALVHGCIREEMTIKTGIRRREESIIFREVCPVEEGDYAETQVVPLATDGERTLVRLVPCTGRTHQLRVHLASVGHPLLGDDLYGREDGFPRHALHAATLTFPSPTGEGAITVRAPLPRDMREVIETMGREALLLALNETEAAR